MKIIQLIIKKYLKYIILNNSCLTCKKGYGPLDNETSDKYMKCYPIQEGYYLDEESKTIKQCYSSCKICDKGGSYDKHNCNKCKDNYPYNMKLKNLNLLNCYENCPSNYSYYIDDIENIKYCIIKCDEIYDKYIENEKRCVKKCEGEYKYEFKKKCYKECPDNSISLKYNEYSCEIKCEDKNYPYLKIDTQECITN